MVYKAQHKKCVETERLKHSNTCFWTIYALKIIQWYTVVCIPGGKKALFFQIYVQNCQNIQ